MPISNAPSRQRRRERLSLVFDASPLIILDQLGYLPALRDLHGKIIIPHAVARELAHSPGMPAAHVPDLDWVEIREVPNDLLRRVLEGPPSLDAGEAAAIGLALDESTTVVLDDLRGRERARRLGVPITGTIGEILALHRLSLTTRYADRSPHEELDALRDAGMHFSDELRDHVLRELISTN
jgi:predicted nucleic acid-binding protein